MVRRDLLHEELPIPATVDLIANGVQIHTNGGTLNIFAAYRPPSANLKASDFGAVLQDPAPTVVVGDLNAKHTAWGSRLISAAGAALYNAAERLDFEIIGPDEPTHIPHQAKHTPDVLDVVAHRNIPGSLTVEALYDLDEAHLPILVTVGMNIAPMYRRPLERTDWAYFGALLHDVQMGPLNTAEEVESAAVAFTKALQVAKKASTTAVQHLPTRRHELPLKIQADLAKKKLLRKQWAQTRCPTIKTALNELTEKVASAVTSWRGFSWELKLVEANEYAPTLHRICRSLTSTPQPVYPIQDSSGKRHYAPTERARLLADHLERQFVPHPVGQEVTPHVIAHHQIVVRSVEVIRSLPPTSFERVSFISPKEVCREIRRLPRKKAPGDDELPIAAIYNLPHRAVVTMTRLFNGILRTCHFPTTWKLAKVIVIPKPGKDKRNPGAYRPISLLPHIAKLFERLLLRRIAPYLKPRDEQFGFRRGHSTTLQLVRVLHMMACSLNAKKHTVAVFLDVEKAFDRVWHEGLLYKIAKRDLPHPLWRLIDSYLTARSFYVSVDLQNSSTRSISAGVPQGSCLSPALYGAFTDDIPTLKGQLRPEERDVELALFADDSAYIATSPRAKNAARKVQRALDLLSPWLDEWRMAVNVGKTAALFVSRKRIRPDQLQLKGQQIVWSNSVKYLGVHIDRGLTMNVHAKQAIGQASAARALLRPLLHAKLPLRTKLGIYKTYIRARLTYAFPAWFNLCSRSLKTKLQTQQNVALRICTGAGRYVRNDIIARDTKMESLEEFAVRLSRKLFDAADNGPHRHLRGLAPHQARPPEEEDRKSRRHLPRELLDTSESSDDAGSE